MPRKKVEPTSDPTIESTKPKTTRRTKKVEEPTLIDVPPTEDPKPKAPARSRTRKVEETPAVAPTRARKAAAPKSQPEELAPPAETKKAGVPKTLAEEVEEEKRHPRPRRRAEAAKTQDSPPKADPKPSRGKPAKVNRQPEPTFELDSDEILTISWRPRGEAPVQPKGRPEPAEQVEAGEGSAPRRSRRKRRKDLQDVEITAAAALVKEPKPERREREPRPEPRARAKEVRVVEKPAAPVGPPPKPLIRIPDDAPQVVVRAGLPTLVRKGRVYPPIAFFGSAPDEARARTVLEEVRLAGEAGVHVHSILVDVEVDLAAVDGSVAFAAYMLAQILKADPQAQVLFRLVFLAPPNWTDQYADARYHAANGALGDPSVCDDQFWSVARECLARFCRQMRMLDARDHILGVHLERGEWFFGEDWGYDNSPAAKTKFRLWARHRYQNDEVALRAAWFDGSASFNSLQIPNYRQPRESGEKFVRSSRRERRWVDYHLFLSDATVERIGDLAYAAKEASEGYFLVGVSYGYTFEWSHPGSGHLSLGKLLRLHEIDFIAGPPSYRSREPGGAAPFPCPVDSFSLNGKLYLSEEDFKTSIGDRNEPDEFNPVIKTPQALESVHWRGAGSALAHGAGVCWMDLWGNGWLKTQGTWDRAARVADALTARMASPLADPDVAVFIDERALAYLSNPHAFALLGQNVRESVLRSGLSAGFYLLSDLQHRERFPEAKLYIFLNAWDVRPELRAAIKNRLQRDNKVLFWLYAAGLFDSGRESLERAREVTGIALRPQPFHSRTGTTILNRRHPLAESFPDSGLVAGGNMEPSYFAIPEESTVLGEYSQTGLPSFVVREFPAGDKSWRSVFLGEPSVTPALIRALGQMAGAHVWNFQEDVVHVRAPFVSIHCRGAGQRTLPLPNKWCAYDLIDQRWEQTDTNSIRFTAVDGATHTFLVGTQEEIEQILAADPVDLLKMAELPPKPEDTVRFDVATFDIPIMRLDEWMEGGDDDEMADDFLFKPRLIEEPEEEAEESVVGRRRRRRKRRGGGEEGAAAHKENVTSFDDLGMNVMFRKRE